MILRPIQRRTLLRGLACGLPVAVGLPILEAQLNTNGTAFAQGEPLPRRFGVFFWGNGRGVEAERWNPAQSGADWQLSPQLEPLADYKNYLNVVSGTRVRLSNSPQGHHKGTVGILSGRDFITQEAGDAPFRSTYAGPSIDQTIAQVVGIETPFPSLEIGISERVIRGEGTTLQFLSHNGPDNANPPEYDPVELFDRIFGSVSGGGGDPGLIQAVTAMKKSVLDNITQDLNALRLRVGARDKTRLDQHLQNIRDIEKRLGGAVDLTAQCASPTAPGELPDPDEGEPLVERMTAMSDLIALALACDMTRVFSIMYSGSAAGPVFSQLGITRGNHELSHEGEAAQDEIDRSTIFTMAELGRLLGALNSAVEGDSTLLGQSAILVSSDCSDGAAHSVNDYPILVAGSAGGFLKNPGVHHATDGENSTQVLLTLVRAMGLQATEFGADDGLVTESAVAIEA